MVTKIGEIVFKQVRITEKSACEISRTMRQTPESKCTIDEENDKSDDERTKKCSSIEFCWDNGYKNSNCPDNEHCANWTMPSGDLFSGCVLSKECFKSGTYTGEEVMYNCVNEDDRDEPVALPEAYISP